MLQNKSNLLEENLEKTHFCDKYNIVTYRQLNSAEYVLLVFSQKLVYRKIWKVNYLLSLTLLYN